MQLYLFGASEHVRSAYDQLVLAFEDAELEQLETLKQMTLRTYVAIMDMQIAKPIADDQEQIEVPF